jgi:signal transduction histidine kinase
MLYGIYRLRLRQLTIQLNLRFEERLVERTRIARELHDTLLQGLLSVSMQLQVAVDSIAPDSPAKPIFGRVLEVMGKVIDEGRTVVTGLRLQTDLLDLEEAFTRIKQELTSHEQMGFQITVKGRSRPLRPIVRDEVYRIGREALVNAFRHSQANTVEIELEYAARHLRLLVRDNGCGINPRVVQSGRGGHWGLVGMRERAERIGGRIIIWSRHSTGTEVDLLVPGKVAFQVPPSIIQTLRGWVVGKASVVPRQSRSEQ